MFISEANEDRSIVRAAFAAAAVNLFRILEMVDYVVESAPGLDTLICSQQRLSGKVDDALEGRLMAVMRRRAGH